MSSEGAGAGVWAVGSVEWALCEGELGVVGDGRGVYASGSSHFTDPLHHRPVPRPPRPSHPAAHGLKFAQSKVAYHSKEIEGVASRYANPPVAVRANLGAVMDGIRTKFQL